MKKLAYLLIIVIILGSISCKKSNNDDPPTPTPKYTIKYSVVSTGNVEMDTIKYMDIEGTEKYLTGESNFEHTFVQPSTNYHAYLYVSGEIIDGSCNYHLRILDEDGGIVHMKEDGHTSTQPYTFKWWAESSKTEN